MENHMSYKGTNKLLVGIVLAVLSFWLFAQSILNMAPDVQADLGVPSSVMETGISLTALFSGLFIVVAGGLADRAGEIYLFWSFIKHCGFVLSNLFIRSHFIYLRKNLSRISSCFYYARYDGIS